MRTFLTFVAVAVVVVAMSGCGEKKQEVKITTPDGKEMKMEVKK
ncbi:MAG TPA: hypothetical protein VEK08_14520 [Planctomycetota bacterium]|nr:hypothetical protein [Planctomycetota bacterium]